MSKLITLNALAKRLSSPQFRSKTKVLVTGCFDVLHQEHQKFLQKAKKEGNLLIVGLESDQRVKELKGKNRPLNPWPKRAQSLLQLNEVDFVFALPDDFGSLNKRRKTLQLIKPHALAISAHDPLKKQKQKECQRIGCQVKIVHQYNPRVSTTKIVFKIKNEKLKTKNTNLNM